MASSVPSEGTAASLLDIVRLQGRAVLLGSGFSIYGILMQVGVFLILSASAGKRIWGAYLDPAAFTILLSVVLEFHALFVFVFLVNGWKDSLHMTIKGIIPTTIFHIATFFLFAVYQLRNLRIAMSVMAVATFTVHELIKGMHYFEIAEKHVTPENATKSRRARLRWWYLKWFKLGVSVAGLKLLATFLVQFSSILAIRFLTDIVVQVTQISAGAVLRSAYNNILVTMGVVSKKNLSFMQKIISVPNVTNFPEIFWTYAVVQVIAERLLPRVSYLIAHYRAGRMARAEITEDHVPSPTRSPSKFWFPRAQLPDASKVEPAIASEEVGLPQYSQPRQQSPSDIAKTTLVPTTEQLNEDYVEYRNNHAVMSFAATTIAISSTFLVGWSKFVATNGERGPWLEQLFQVAALWYVLGFLFEVILVRMEHWRGLPIGPLPNILEATTWYFGSHFPVIYLVVYLGAHELYGLVPEQR
ncbi:hypothetical protein HDU96_010369 [Phlyctochytrium bullatum]|nr:hypothetical protein HDU96_010369 [Phlyctochytrium bullatum]